MKKILTVLALLLAVLLTFSACTQGTGSTASSAGADDSAAVTVNEADYFSDRDRSGAWDESKAVSITLNGNSAACDGSGVEIDGSVVTITAEGVYVLSGTLDDGCIVVNATKDEKVQLVLDGVTITSSGFAPIYVKQADKVFVTLADSTLNTLTNGGSFTAIDENDVDAVIFSKDDLTLNGTGTLTISSTDNGVSCKDDLKVTGGSYVISASSKCMEAKDSIRIADGSFALTAGTDGIHAENDEDDSLGYVYIGGGSFSISAGDDGIHGNAFVQIDGGSFQIAAAEGIEASYVQINDGSISIQSWDDGINAANKSGAYPICVEINGGDISIAMSAGDTDGIDANGSIVINGGTISITGNSGFDYDGTAQLNGGSVIVNGQTLDYIPNQMMGGGMGGFGSQMGGFGGTGGMGGQPGGFGGGPGSGFGGGPGGRH